MRHINYVLKPATIDNAKTKDKRYDLKLDANATVTVSGTVWRSARTAIARHISRRLPTSVGADVNPPVFAGEVADLDMGP